MDLLVSVQWVGRVGEHHSDMSEMVHPVVLSHLLVEFVAVIDHVNQLV